MSWIRCNRNRSCGVCGKPDWCCFTEEGYAMCMRTDGNEDGWDTVKSVPTNGGFILRRTGHVHKQNFEPQQKNKKESAIVWKPIVDSFSIGTRPGAGDWLAEQLGIPRIFLEMFGLGWSEQHKAFTFPMYDEEFNITGVRLRRVDGSKKSIRGSRDGVFLPYFEFVEPMLITEGPTDAASLVSVGYATIGRPSCLGGVEIVAKLVHNKDVVIVTDKDSPGRQGAERLAARLVPIAKGIKIIEPTGESNDAREWINSGATQEVIQTVIESALDYRKQRIRA